MARPRKPRNCSCPQRSSYNTVFKPAGIPLADLALIPLQKDELEAFYLCDGGGKTQVEAGVCMGISRGTVQRLLSAGRKKIAHALVHDMALAIGRKDW